MKNEKEKPKTYTCMNCKQELPVGMTHERRARYGGTTWFECSQPAVKTGGPEVIQ